MSLPLPPLLFLSCHPLLSLLCFRSLSSLLILHFSFFSSLLFYSYSLLLNLCSPSLLPSLSSAPLSSAPLSSALSLLCHSSPLLSLSSCFHFSALPLLSPPSLSLLHPSLCSTLSPTGSFSANFDRTGAHCLGRGKRMSVFGATAFYPQGHCCS